MKNEYKNSARRRPRFPPLSGQRLIKTKTTTITLKTLNGEIALRAVYGFDPGSGQWMNPLRLRLGLEPKQTVSPEVIERVCFTATQARSYHSAERVAECWGVEISDSTIQHHVCQQGERIEAQRAAQVQEALEPSTRGHVVRRAGKAMRGERFSMVIMLDGWMIRERGADWGLKAAEAPGQRVDWREMKTGIVFRLEDQVATQSGRGMVLRKFFEAWRGDPRAFGERLFALALRKGLYHAQRVYVVADGAVWIWNLVGERFATATGQLDFYHASQHLWAVARALHEDNEAAARAWVEPRLSQLRHGQQQRVVDEFDAILDRIGALTTERQNAIQTNADYFRKHRDRLDYETNTAHGCPAGSGAMESTCSQLQDRFKRTGQFWTQPGAAHLLTIEIIDRNEEWDDYWEEMVA